MTPAGTSEASSLKPKSQEDDSTKQNSQEVAAPRQATKERNNERPFEGFKSYDEAAAHQRVMQKRALQQLLKDDVERKLKHQRQDEKQKQSLEAIREFEQRFREIKESMRQGRLRREQQLAAQRRRAIDGARRVPDAA